ncbi:MAG: elongation factor Ts [Porticoccaceae bacterium]|jgi:elongation factor Ts|nr:elongation factor Ts [Porticoccaceae bacterium]MBT4592182.1 elongation factor Ts [Porticoccaceae bacterium]MBT5102780.1 elongation factor Ts [Porticoccaceae bacterium]MBT6692814.1 elongation factor Ts [Porticoccaceae bacterium]MBT7965030.1 elongation factor Ts [Porticoccaceae bacterium]|tara:strand:+ start:187 stop:1047 length:861 start_codon:yes stop_codon:yes gene_type:complete
MAQVTASLVKELRERTGLGMMECKRALAEADADIDKAIEELRKSSGMKAAKKAGRTAADGLVSVKVEAGYGVVVEVNSETDFVTKDEGFQGFVASVLDSAFVNRKTDMAAVMAGDLESAREALVQKTGENISPRRADSVEAPVVGGYVHSNNRIAVLVGLSGGSEGLARDVAMHVAAVNPAVVSSDQMPAEVVAAEKEIFAAQARESGKPEEIIEKMIVGRVSKFLKESSLVDQPFVKDPDMTVGKLVKEAGAEVLSFVRFEVGEGIEVEQVDFATEVAAQVKGAS